MGAVSGKMALFFLIHSNKYACPDRVGGFRVTVCGTLLNPAQSRVRAFGKILF